MKLHRTPEEWKESIIGTQYPPILFEAVDDIDTLAAANKAQAERIVELERERDVALNYYDAIAINRIRQDSVSEHNVFIAGVAVREMRERGKG